jgi:hypothetical protein
VTHLKTLPTSEFQGWLAFYAEKDRRDRARRGDLCAMDDDEIVDGLKQLGIVE